MLAKELRAEDRVAIMVYAGAAAMVLESTSGAERESILRALDRLGAGGTTAAGSAGIRLAYDTALSNFKEKGNNRVILATDGDFNGGASSVSEFIHLLEKAELLVGEGE